MMTSLCLSMIVRDEASRIAATLRSVRPYITSYSISDTGSTDDTMAIIREELAGVPGVLTRDPWLGYGPSREVAMRRATGSHVLFMDAGEEFTGGEPPLRLHPAVDRFDLMVEQQRTDQPPTAQWQPRLIRRDVRWQWRELVRNELLYTMGEPSVARLEQFRVRRVARRGQYAASQRALDLLAVCERLPQTPSHLFYQAQLLRRLGQFEAAHAKYLERAETSEGWEEEVYCSLWLAAHMLHKLNAPIEEVMAGLSIAFRSRPTRYEALLELVQLLHDMGRFEEQYELTSIITTPSTDVLMVEPRGFWLVIEEHGVGAYHTDRHAEAKRAFLKALEYATDPMDRERLEQNLSFCD